MNEYKVKFRARARILFGPSGEVTEVYEAESAKKAIEACKEEFFSQIPDINREDVEFTIVDVEKV